MVGWSKAETEVVVSLSGVDRLLLKRVADALDPVTVQPTAEKPRRLREPAYENPEWVVPKETVDRIGLAGLKKLASANGAQPEVEVALSGDEFAELQAGVLSHRGDEVVRSVLKRLLTVNDPHFRGKHLSVRECPERFVSAEDIV